MLEYHVGKAIKILRRKNNMSQWDLYRATGLVPGYISKLENEKIKHPNIKTILRLAKAFKIKASEFISIAEGDGSD